MPTKKIDLSIPEKICDGEPQAALLGSTFKKCLISGRIIPSCIGSIKLKGGDKRSLAIK